MALLVAEDEAEFDRRMKDKMDTIMKADCARESGPGAARHRVGR